MGALPRGLTGEFKLRRAVKADAILAIDDVELDEKLTAVSWRKNLSLEMQLLRRAAHG